MPVLLFKSQGAPEDEVEDIRQLLVENSIPFYETQEGRWKLGVAGMWLADGEYLKQAQSIIEEYQRQRYDSFDEARLSLEQNGFLTGIFMQFREKPLQFTLSILSVIIVLGISILPFVF